MGAGTGTGVCCGSVATVTGARTGTGRVTVGRGFRTGALTCSGLAGSLTSTDFVETNCGVAAAIEAVAGCNETGCSKEGCGKEACHCGVADVRTGLAADTASAGVDCGAVPIRTIPPSLCTDSFNPAGAVTGPGLCASLRPAVIDCITAANPVSSPVVSNTAPVTALVTGRGTGGVAFGTQEITSS
jgi:hypothetical protein